MLLSNVRLLTLCTLTLFVSPVFSASFDCSKAKSTNEKHICGVANLSKLDDLYAATYKNARKQSPQPDKVKSEARLAWRWREANCNSVPCLQQWYVERILSIQEQLQPKATPGLSLLQLYKRLNLATLAQSTHSSNDASSYPIDAFARTSITIESNDTLIFDDDGIATSISLMGQNKIRFARWARGMRPKYVSDGQVFAVYFNKIYNDWRVGTVGQSDTDDLTTRLTYRGRHGAGYDSDFEPYSVGEFVLSSFRGPAEQSGCNVKHLGIAPDDTKLCEIPPVNLYSEPSGKRIGSMRIALVRGQATGAASAEVWLLDQQGLTIAEPVVIVRRKEEVVLLTFGITKTKQHELGWLNISPNPLRPAWVNREDMYNGFNTVYMTREQVVDSSSEVRLNSNHNLRVEPSTKSPVIAVMEPGNGSVYPMNVKGDWMQVQFINPSPPVDWLLGLEQKLDSSYQQLQGWIKWRKHVGREYVTFNYWYD